MRSVDMGGRYEVGTSSVAIAVQVLPETLFVVLERNAHRYCPNMGFLSKRFGSKGPSYDVAEVYTGLRGQALDLAREDGGKEALVTAGALLSAEFPEGTSATTVFHFRRSSTRRTA